VNRESIQTLQRVTIPDTETSVSELTKIEEIEGKLSTQDEEDKLMHSVMESDKKTIDKGKLVEEAMNHGINSFMPDMMFEQLVSNYKNAKNIFGESILRQLAGYDSDFIERNMRIPEFQRTVKANINKNLKKLKQDGLLDNEFSMTDKAFELASVVMYMEEIDNITPKGIHGERIHKRLSHYGAKEEIKNYKKGDRFKDLAIRKTVKAAIRRQHKNIEMNDLRVFERESKGQCYIIYALDASGSMKGKKVGSCKRAGIALAYKATTNKDKVGLIVFGEDIKTTVSPTLNFSRLLVEIAKIRAARQTDIVKSIERAIEMFPSMDVTKHLIILSDALPTSGKDPEGNTLKAVSMAKAKDITISVVGINIDKKGIDLAEKMIEISGGKLYVVKDLENVDKLILQEYYRIM